MTQNAYSIFEGPTSDGLWTDFHTFAPVSPNIMILMRSFLLPSGIQEDESRKFLLELTQPIHPDPTATKSCLEDIPVAKARNNYSKIVNGKPEPLPTRISREKHIFYFRFFRLETKHVQKINILFLEEAKGTMAFVYKNPIGLRRALELHFLDEMPGLKSVMHLQGKGELSDILAESNDHNVNEAPQDSRESYLLMLQETAKQLGSTVQVKYGISSPAIVNGIRVDDKQMNRYLELG